MTGGRSGFRLASAAAAACWPLLAGMGPGALRKGLGSARNPARPAAAGREAWVRLAAQVPVISCAQLERFADCLNSLLWCPACAAGCVTTCGLLAAGREPFCLGEPLPVRPARSGRRAEQPRRTLAQARCRRRRPAISQAPPSCGKRSPSTSASEPLPPAASKKRSQPCPADQNSSSNQEWQNQRPPPAHSRRP